MRACNAVASAIVSLLLVSAGVAEDSLWNMSMPTIESPSLGTGFYTPSGSSSPFMSGRSGQSAPAAAPSASASPSAASEPASPAESRASPSSFSRTLQNSISARDLETLDSLGLLGGLSGILSERYGGSLYSRSVTAASDRTDETNRLLTRVLEKMEELKASGEASRAASASAATAVLVADEGEAGPSVPAPSAGSSASSGRSRSRLLRFAVNGYNVLRTCRTVYISDVQADGTFLVTGDRRYVSDGQTRSETFHILFRTKADAGQQTDYDAATAVTQDSYNPNSFVYQLSRRKNMMASRTGNLVSMRTEDPDWRLELLIDLGE